MKEIYVLDRLETVKSVLSTDANSVSTIPILSAHSFEKLGSYDVLEIEVLASHEDSLNIHDDGTLVFKDEFLGWREYHITKIEDVDSGDSIIKHITAELSSIELLDLSFDGKSNDTNMVHLNLANFLRGSRFTVGNVDASIKAKKLTKKGLEELKHKTILECIYSYAKKADAEVYFSYEVDKNKVVTRKVNFITKLGSDNGKRFELGKDVLSVKREVDYSNIKTAIIPTGDMETEHSVEDGVTTPKEQMTNSSEELTIASVKWSKPNNPADKPLGQEWLGNPETLKMWGRKDSNGNLMHKFIHTHFSIKNPEELITMAWVELGKYKQPKVTYELNVIDLFALTGNDDYRHENVVLGDIVSVVDENFPEVLTVETRVVEIERDLLEPSNTKIVLGDSKQSYASHAVSKEEELDSKFNDLVEKAGDKVTSFLSGNKTTHYGSVEPKNPKTNDLWFRPHPQKPDETQLVVWDGVQWIVEIDTSVATEAFEKTKTIKEDLEKSQAEIIEIRGKATEGLDKALEQAKKVEANTARITDNIKSISDAKTLLSKTQQDLEGSKKDISSARSETQKALGEIAKLEVNIDNVSKTTIKQGTDLKLYSDSLQAQIGKITAQGTELASLKLESGKLSSSITEVSKKVDDIQVGGRNYLLDSTDISKAMTISSNNHAEFPIKSQVLTEKNITFYRIMRDKISNGSNVFSIYNNIKYSQISVDHMTLKNIKISFKARAKQKIEFVVAGKEHTTGKQYPNIHGKKIMIDTEWKTFSFNIDSFYNGSTGMYILPTNPTSYSVIKDLSKFYLDLAEYKIETGSVATDWSPAPEDLASQNDVVKLNTSIAQASDSITAQVAKIDANASQLAKLQVEAGKISSSVTEVEKDIKYLNNNNGINYWSESDIVGNFYINHLGVKTEWVHTNLIERLTPVKEGDNLIIQFWNPTGKLNGDPAGRLNFYDDKKVWKAQTDKINLTVEPYKMYNITVPKGIHFFNMHMPKLDGIKIKIEKGTIPTEWTPAINDLSTSKELKTVSSKLEQTAKDVTAQVAKIDANSSQIAKLQVEAGKISSSITEVGKKVDDIQVGVTNLLPNSEAPKFKSSLSSKVVYEENIYVEEWKAKNAVKHNITGGTSSIIGVLFAPNKTLVNNTNYIHSIYIKNTGNKKLGINSNLDETEWIEPLENKRLVMSRYHLSNVSAMQFVLYREAVSDSIEFVAWHAQIEEGTIVSDWSPAPEDLALDSDVKTISSKLEQTSKDITAQVSKIDANSSQIANLNISTDKINSSIISLEKDKASNKDLTALGSSIEQTLSGIQATVKNKADTSQVTQLSNSISSVVKTANESSSKVTQLSNQITSVIQDNNNNKTGIVQLNNQVSMFANSLYGGNFLYNSDFKEFDSSVEEHKSITGWTSSMIKHGGSIVRQTASYNMIGASYSLLFTLGTNEFSSFNSRRYDIPEGASVLSASIKHKAYRAIGLQNITIQLRFFNADEKYLSTKDTKIESFSGSTWQTSKLENIEVPIGAKKFIFDIYVNGKTNGAVYICQPQIKLGSTIGEYTAQVPNVSSRIDILQDNIQSTVQKGDIISTINQSPEKITLSAKFIHISGETKIDNAVIDNSAIKNLSADKINTGTLNAKNVRVINLDASNIVTGTLSSSLIKANSITSEMLASNAIQVGFNQLGQTMKLDSTSLSFYSGGRLSGKLTDSGQEFWYGSRLVGSMGERSKSGDDNCRGVSNQLNYQGDYISWSYKKSSSDSSYTTLLLLDPRGRFTGRAGIHVDQIMWVSDIGVNGAIDNLAFRTKSISNRKLPSLTSSSGDAGIMFDRNEIVFLQNNTPFYLSRVIKFFNALGTGSFAIPISIGSDGTANRWVSISI